MSAAPILERAFIARCTRMETLVLLAIADRPHGASVPDIIAVTGTTNKSVHVHVHRLRAKGFTVHGGRIDGAPRKGINDARLERYKLDEDITADRAGKMVRELATMTDIETEFLDAEGLRDACRSIVAGEIAVLPRLYSEEDRERALAALRKSGALFTSYGPGYERADLHDHGIDAVAEALGMRRAGA